MVCVLVLLCSARVMLPYWLCVHTFFTNPSLRVLLVTLLMFQVLSTFQSSVLCAVVWKFLAQCIL